MINDVRYYMSRFVRGFVPIAAVRPALAAISIIAILASVPAVRAADAAKPEDVQFFEKQVRPLLEARCLKCHGAEAKVKGGLHLTSRESVLKGGEQGIVVSVDQPDKSLLLAAIGYEGELKMPPKGKLPAEEAQILTRWVKSGLPWTPGLDLTPAGVASAEPVRSGPPTIEEAKSFWSFKPIEKSAVPQVHHVEWVRNPIDAFVLSKLESKGMSPAQPADRIALLRRAYYDLTGLPPTPTEVNAFMADPSPDAYEKEIDKLLASPHYGEKWGRYWLDLVRYGESNSYERDNPKPNVWRFRDYVIRSFNDDKPYDRFVKEQLAGDEMPEAAENADPIIATGFYRLGIWDDEPNDRLQARYDNLDDLVTATGQVFLGLTVDCARCHNHKIDPIPQADYYRLLAFFQNINGYSNGGP
ncbi:MAG: Planctomycete cytochrome, partial [Phycisphaerales bacterium]|nr:Planctomycete cytochrome [Phycisphaerales bacterium]